MWPLDVRCHRVVAVLVLTTKSSNDVLPVNSSDDLNFTIYTNIHLFRIESRFPGVPWISLPTNHRTHSDFYPNQGN